ncbi:MAG: methyltransferase domain-containing protein [Saprospiraceae bacterium]|nr:methyltransferase domain-containing protein [Saprospiraceae bacterium]
MLDESYWNNRYISDETPWSLGQVSPPLKAYIDQLDDKNLRILIPGAGDGYEAIYLAEQGFQHITVCDIAENAIQRLAAKTTQYSTLQLIHGNFFNMEGTYDLILEQTFFCAIDPGMRVGYCQKTFDLLSKNGKLTGLLFEKTFEQKGPPFGGNINEYKSLFNRYFYIKQIDMCFNSVKPRAGAELFFICQKLSL